MQPSNKKKPSKKNKSGNKAISRGPMVQPPEGAPFDFDDFVSVLQQNRIYAHKIHKLIIWGRDGHEADAIAELDTYHVHYPPVFRDLSISEADIDPKRCSNNTKFSMLDFAKYV
jgi:hypothetical protein